MTTHTPGPWWACIGEDQPVAYYRGLVAFVSTTPAMSIVTGEHGDRYGRVADSSEWEANARLMAAAPEMFEALRRLVRIERVLIDRGPGISDDKLEDVLTLAEAALAKASPVSPNTPSAEERGT